MIRSLVLPPYIARFSGCPGAVLQKINKFNRLPAILLFLASLPGLFSQTRPDALREYLAGNYERAAGICREELTANPTNLEPLVVICWSLIRLGRFSEAQGYARIAQSISRNDTRVTEILGELAYYEGRNIEALQYFQEYINRKPDGSRIDQVYYLVGEIYIRLGRFRHADIALSTAVHWMQGNAAWWARLAYARENALDLAGAVAAYEKALSLDPRLQDARRGLERVRGSLAAR